MRNQSLPSPPPSTFRYVQEDILQPSDPHYRQFHKVFEQFKIVEPAEPKTPTEESPVKMAAKKAAAVAAAASKGQEKEADSDDEEEEEVSE